MPQHKVKVVQVFKTTRTIEFYVAADTMSDAIDQVNGDVVDIPPFDSPGWRNSWDLQNEEVTNA